MVQWKEPLISEEEGLSIKSYEKGVNITWGSAARVWMTWPPRDSYGFEAVLRHRTQGWCSPV